MMIACFTRHDVAPFRLAPHEGSATTAHGADNAGDLGNLEIEP
ncbi:hypothetical protein [Labrys sp. La1]